MPGSPQAYDGNDPFIFISYAHGDVEPVAAELLRITEQGFNVWFDEGIHAGTAWRDELADRILACNRFLFYASPKSVISRNCLKEVHFALDSNKPIIVVHLEDTPMPPGLRLALGDIQAIMKHRLDSDSYERKLSAALHKQAPLQERRLARRSHSGFDDDVISIAVLPFVNMSNDTEQEYFCDGITEEIINGLVRFAELKVIARTSSFEFKGKNVDIRVIGERLNVNHLLQGSVRKSGNRIRVTAQLVTVDDGTHLWSEKYDRELVDVFDLQDAITTEILKALDVVLAGGKRIQTRKVDVDAYNALLLGRYHAYRMEYPPALAAYEEALSLDPDYADVHAGLAQIHMVQNNISPSPELQRRELDHLDQALAADPDQPMAQCIRLQRGYLAGQLQQALDEFHHLLKLRPNEHSVVSFYGSFATCIRAESLSLALHDRLVELDPLNALSYFQKAEALRYFGHFDAARRAYSLSGELGMPVTGSLAVLASDEGDTEALAAYLQTPAEQWGVIEHYRQILSASLHYLRGDTDALAAMLPGLEQAASSHYDRAIIAALRRDWAAAARWYSEGMRAGEWLVFSYALGTAGYKRNLPELFETPEYVDMLESAGLGADALGRLTIHPLPF